jgi:outer membrane protein TolC
MHRSQIRSAEARMQQARMDKTEEERNIETEVRNLAARVQSVLGRLQQQERNIPVAEKNFEITLSRYANGDIDSQVLSEARERLNNAYVSRLDAFTAYQIALIDLMRNTFYDFQRGMAIE